MKSVYIKHEHTFRIQDNADTYIQTITTTTKKILRFYADDAQFFCNRKHFFASCLCDKGSTQLLGKHSTRSVCIQPFSVCHLYTSRVIHTTNNKQPKRKKIAKERKIMFGTKMSVEEKENSERNTIIQKKHPIRLRLLPSTLLFIILFGLVYVMSSTVTLCRLSMCQWREKNVYAKKNEMDKNKKMKRKKNCERKTLR